MTCVERKDRRVHPESPAKRIVFSGLSPGGCGSDPAISARSAARRIFLLSPANAAGARAQLLLRTEARSELAQRLRTDGVALGDLFSFMSALYFRGKLSYAQAFANAPANLPRCLVITPSRGLLPPETIITLRDIQEMVSARVDLANDNYVGPLRRDAHLLMSSLGRDVDVVLLGSIATPKYVAPLVEIFGQQLVFPHAFLGLGDMSRGGLLLRCCRNQQQLDYVQAMTAMPFRRATASSTSSQTSATS
jgi:hypothetical protein